MHESMLLAFMSVYQVCVWYPQRPEVNVKCSVTGVVSHHMGLGLEPRFPEQLVLRLRRHLLLPLSILINPH